MEKRTLFAVVALVVLGLGAWLTLRAPEKGQRSGPPPRPVAAIKAADVAHLELTNEKQEKTVLDKKGDAWRITAPADQPADQSAVKTLLDGLEKLGFADVVTESEAKHEELGVKEGKAQRLVAKSGAGALLADVLIGKSVGGFTMLRVAGKNDVWQANGLFPYMINREPKGWRDHAIFDGQAQASDAEKLTIEEGAGANKVTFEKAGDKWKVASASGDAPKADAGPDDLDQGMIAGAVQSLIGLRANDFADGKKAADVGLDKPAFTITAVVKGAPRTLLVGPLGEDVFVKRADDETIYTVKKYALERLAHRPADFRDKTLVKAKEADLAAVEITMGTETATLEKSGDKWQLKGGKEVDDGKVKSLLGAFESLVGAGFAAEKDPAKTGLAKPTATVVVRTTDKKATTLKVGALKDNSDYYVQRVGSPDVLLLKKFVAERFLKKAADLAPTKTAAAAPAPAPTGGAAKKK
jgi:hypothetical protein